jgi:hypothetical protein
MMLSQTFTATQFEVLVEWLKNRIADKYESPALILSQIVITELYKRIAIKVEFPQPKRRISLKVSEAIAIYMLSAETTNYVVRPLRGQIHQKYLTQ